MIRDDRPHGSEPSVFNIQTFTFCFKLITEVGGEAWAWRIDDNTYTFRHRLHALQAGPESHESTTMWFETKRGSVLLATPEMGTAITCYETQTFR